jgi:hypothetical protein
MVSPYTNVNEGARTVRGDGPTVRALDPDAEPEVAVIVLVPRFFAVASPVELMVATPVSDDVHATELLRSVVVPSE